MSVGKLALLAPVSLDIQRGEILAIRGANGAGKTTLLRVIAGMTPPTVGSVQLDGEPVSERTPGARRRIAALIGVPPLARDLTLAEHLTLIGRSWAVEAAPEEALALLGQLTLGRFRDRFPHELSSGQTQLFMLALVLARPGDLLVLDEPEQRLDADRTRVIAALLREKAENGTAIILATHSDTLVAALGARELHLEEPVDDAA